MYKRMDVYSICVNMRMAFTFRMLIIRRMCFTLIGRMMPLIISNIENLTIVR